MNPNDKRISAKYRGGKITSGFVITAVTILIFVLLLLLLMKLGVVRAPAFLQSVFSPLSGEGTESSSELPKSVIPDFSAGPAEEEYYYASSGNPQEILTALTEWEAYTREFRVINFYGEERDVHEYTLTVNGSRFRLESSQKTVICDGDSTCTLTSTYRSTLDGTVFTPENEVGITSLSQIKAEAATGSIEQSADDKTLIINMEDPEAGVSCEYVVSIETGVVMSEIAYLNGERYRVVITDAVDVFAADDLPEDYFEIPQDNND